LINYRFFNNLASYGVAKWRENSGSRRIFRYDYIVHRRLRFNTLLTQMLAFFRW